MNHELAEFVDHARDRGLDLSSIRLLLISAGWKDKEIATAYAERALDLQVPRPMSVGSARDTFFQMLGFSTLYTWVVSLVILCFNYVDLGLPDSTEILRYESEMRIHSSIRVSLACLVVSFPFFLLIWRSLLRERSMHPERSLSMINRWLTYATLFAGAAALISDVTTLVYYFFEGELTTRFILKVLVLFAIAGLVILYLTLSLRNESENRS